MSLAFPKPEPEEPRTRTALRRGGPLRRRSSKRASQERTYNRQVKEWLPGRRCAVFPRMRATQVHHKYGRDGALLLDKRYWIPVSAKGQRHIHSHPAEAYEKGWLGKRNGARDA